MFGNAAPVVIARYLEKLEDVVSIFHCDPV